MAWAHLRGDEHDGDLLVLAVRYGPPENGLKTSGSQGGGVYLNTRGLATVLKDALINFCQAL